jgi:hypothetical protein
MKTLLESVRLTEEEIDEADDCGLLDCLIDQCPDCRKHLLDAQLAKTLWAVLEWLKGWEYLSGGPGVLYGAGWEALRQAMLDTLLSQLEHAGIEKPKETP